MALHDILKQMPSMNFHGHGPTDLDFMNCVNNKILTVPPFDKVLVKSPIFEIVPAYIILNSIF